MVYLIVFRVVLYFFISEFVKWQWLGGSGLEKNTENAHILSFISSNNHCFPLKNREK
jgi:hypothetical protein